MKCIILAAGYATRLYPLTKDKPKPLLDVGGKPMIEHILLRIEEVEDIDEIFVVTNDKFYPHFNDWLSGYKNSKKIKIVNDGTKSNDDRLGAIGDIHFTITNEKIDDDVMVIAGDNLFEFSLKHLVDFFDSKKSTVFALYDIEDKSLAANKYGIVEINDNGKVIGFEEKPADPKTSLVSTACYVFSKEDVEELENCITEHNQPDNLGDFIRYLSKKKHVFGYAFKENWYDIGSHDQLKVAHEAWSAKKTVLVTGGAGFLGSHLCDALVAKGYRVICVDNLFTGKKNNVSHLLDEKNFKFINHDIIEPLFVDEAIDEIYHFACPASPIHYQFNAIRTIKANVLGTINMLGMAKKHNARIMLASTSEVYGDPLEHPQKETYWGNVNCTGIRSCFSEDTEVLTYDGWKFFKDVKKTDKILTLDKAKNIQYHNPDEIIKERYCGDMIGFKNSKIDLQVTPNHNMYVSVRDDTRKTDFKLIKAFEAINWGRAEMLKGGVNWKGEEKKYFYLPPVANSKSGNVDKIKMDDWLEFFGYFITEGCVHIRKRRRIVNNKGYNTQDYNILIAQDRKHIDERKKIKSCLSRLPFTFFDSDDHQYRICNKQLAQYLLQFGKAKDKFIPAELKNASKRQLKILFDALMLGDGSKDGRAYYSSSLRLAGDFQEIVLKLGMAASINVKDKRKPNWVYHVYILKATGKDFLTPLYPLRNIVKYDGHVYCVNVKNHVMYVRRNGKVLFCGNCYDEGKRCAETLMFDYHRQNKVDIRVIRIFNTYGPRMAKDDGRVVSNFLVQAIEGKDITIYGDGKQTRSFCYVLDLIDGILKMMGQDYIGPVNLGNPHEFTILELAEKVIKLSGSKSKIVFEKLPKDDPKQRNPDISLAKEKLGWEPKIKLDEGLKKTYDYFKAKDL